jgi:hypothetical protein
MLDQFIHIENRAGQIIQAGNTQIMPISQAIRMRLPGLPGGLIWNRPVSVVVTSAGGQEQILPIRDITRIAQLAIWAMAVLGSFLFWWASRK